MNSDTHFNIASLLSKAAASWPDLPAIIAPHRPDVLGREQISLSQLDQSSSQVADHLRRFGPPPGARIIVMVKPGLDFIIVIFALFKAGLVPVMVDPGMGLRRMLACLAEGRPSGLIGLSAAHWLSLTTPKAFRGLKFRITIGRRYGWSGATLRDIMAKEPSEQTKRPPTATKAGDVAAILFTSGSTGPAKGVIYTQAMFKAQVEAIRQGFDLQPGGVDLATFPLFGLFAPALGLTSIIPEINPTKPAQADPRCLVEPIIKYNVTSMFASPTLIDKITRFAHEREITLPSLRRVISAGAPVPPRLASSFTSLMSGEGRFLTPYGATEGVPLTHIEAGEIIRETKVMTEQGLGMCVGRPLAGVKIGLIKITDEPVTKFSESLLLPRDEIGEIIAQGPMVSPAYFERPQDTALAIIPAPTGQPASEFWRRMGDVGWVDSEGRLWFCGRKNHRVVTEQGTLFSIPCEAIFNNHPRVRRSALVGVGPAGHQTPLIIIEPQTALKRLAWGALVEELTTLAKTNPRTININTFLKHPSFPVDARHNAKINREKLALWAAVALADGQGRTSTQSLIPRS